MAEPVLGQAALAFVAAGYASLPIIIAVCVLTAFVAYNYIIVCKHFPDGGGVYSAARQQSRFLASVGALLLVANFIVTAALSGWAAVSYLGVPSQHAPVATMGLILIVGILNHFGPRHSGSVSIWLAIPTVLAVVTIILLSAPHLNTSYLEPRHENLGQLWVAFVGVILALSGVEAVANLTGVMKLDPGSEFSHPQVTQTATKAILPVALEVVIGTALLGWAMLSLPKSFSGELMAHKEDMLRFLAQHYAGAAFGSAVGEVFGLVVGVLFGFLLFSAVNTAVVALIGVVYMMAQDGEMPRELARLNRHGVPKIPLVAAVAVVNLGSCSFNKSLGLRWYERFSMTGTFIILCAVEITIAKTKPEALFFAVCVLGVGLALRTYSHKRSGLTTVIVTRQVAEMVSPALVRVMQPQLEEGQRIMVAARGVTPVLSYALDEAQLRKAILCVLYVKEIAVYFSGAPIQSGRTRWQDDPEAQAIMTAMLKLGQERGVCVLPVYAVSDDAASTILDLAATMGVDYLMIGASQRLGLAKLLRSSVATNVAQQLPDSIRLVIYG